MSRRFIQLRGVEVHNLKKVDLDLPHGQLIAFCGVSGSGKTSLALDTLYAEGQRRYIESFSAYTRQFLQQLEKPAAQSIDGIPPAIAVTRKTTSPNSRTTIGTATETVDYLRLLLAKVGRVFCQRCGCEVRRQTPQSAAQQLAEMPEGTRLIVACRPPTAEGESLPDVRQRMRAAGFIRAIHDQRMIDLTSDDELGESENTETILIVVDRLVAGQVSQQRLRDSLETAFDAGGGQCCGLIATQGEETSSLCVEGRSWLRIGFSSTLTCGDCGQDYPEQKPTLFSFNSPLGACPQCEGFGSVVAVDMDLVVPDREKTLREGAIAPWNTPAYHHELEELIELADEYDLPLDIPFGQLDEQHLQLLHEGVAERNFGGLQGFFAWLERRKYKMHVRVFLSRWRSYRTCPTCHGDRLKSEALATRIAGKNIAEICQMKIDEAVGFFQAIELSDWERQVGRVMLQQVSARLGYLATVGLGYLTLDRTLRTLSGGEAQRVALTSALGSNLVNMLYVLDEPSVGLHPRDIDRLIVAIVALRDRGNTVVVVEHEEEFLRAADQLVEIGPEAGQRGGHVIFQGTLAELASDPESTTGGYLSGRRGLAAPAQRRPTNRGRIRLTGACGNNLKDLTIEFPLGVLCLVTGVSGSGKSTLVQDTLYGALCRRKRKEAAKPLPYEDVFGDGQIDDVLLVDQSPIGRSPRSNPVTYVKAFDEIRAVFADTIEARTRNYSAGHFSFNVDGGRCTKCKGDGHIAIDMQFLADVYMQCDECGGTRYRKEILKITYRGRTIAEVLDMTVREAFTFFRGRSKVQQKLKRLMDVGLDYVRLGQPVNTLSAGEAQRLKLAGYLSATRRSRTLLLLDEPTTGLHFADILQLLDCFDALLSVGHSLIVVEHNLQLMKAADWIIDLGPGAADEGGQMVVQGTPEQVAGHQDSWTGQFLARELAKDKRQRTA